DRRSYRSSEPAWMPCCPGSPRCSHPGPAGRRRARNVIDFRYHLVSLISVFLALAVGIVLGAGPLRENLGDQLAGQVEQLRTEQDELRTQADELSTQNDQLASFITEIGPDLVADTLPQSRVAVLTDDSSTGPAIDRMVSLLEEAGTTQVSRIELQQTLWEPGEEQRRAEAVAAIDDIAPGLLDAQLADHEQLADAVVTLLTTPTDEELTADLRTEVWQVLLDQQLVTIDGETPATVGGIVYASASPEALSDESDDEAIATERAQSLLAARTALLTQLTESGTPAVVSGDTPDNDGTQGILRTVRGDADFQELSTTDRLLEADGPL